MTIHEYLTHINTLYITGNAREHSYRGDLQTLIGTLLPGILVTNEPARVACGAPDYVLTRKDVPVGYIEAKDIGIDLKSKTLKEQFDRYRAGLPNIVFTDYLDFHFYKDGELTAKISIAHIADGKIAPEPENFAQFTTLVQNFAETISQTIKSPTRLAKLMAGRAKLMAEVIEVSLNADDATQTHSNLKAQMESFKDMLIHDIDNKAFADIYAQTIAYGMFAARYHDPTLPTFSREEAAQLIPKSNPFLRKLFQDIAGYDLDSRLVWIVEELVRIFLATDVAGIMKNFGRATKQEDPVVHFYETFLASYSPALRKARGVWYTPQPVVNFIVRAVDDILKDEFGLKDGLADTSKTKIKVAAPKLDNRSMQKSKVIGEQFIDKEVHRVQILDPATGTGTFLAEVVRHIHKKFEGQQGIWSKYVSKDLIPRLNGFELLMASYAMAHLKMDMLLTETGYKPTDDQRFRIFLTNSLEEHHKETGSLFSHWLADEANQANAIKRDTPVMVVIGNPPYSGISTNNSDWIQNLIEDYKYVDGEHFKERKHWLNDDYVKFIRFGQHFIEKNGEGILAFINPHGFLDNPTFRGMRWSLLNAFDKIYTIDLHGNSNKKEIAPDGSADQNVFDIQQGVSINLFIKNGKKSRNDLGKIYHYEIYGKRNLKYDFLQTNNLNKIVFKEVKPEKPYLFFIPQNDKWLSEFNEGFKIDNLFKLNVTGIVTARDELVIDQHRENLISKITFFADSNNTDVEVRLKFFGTKKAGKYLAGDSRGWKLAEARKRIQSLDHDNTIKTISHRPFDDRFIYYNPNMVDWGREKLMPNLLHENVGLVIPKINKEDNCFFISNNMITHKLCSAYDSNSIFPLYLYPEDTNQTTTDGPAQRVPNLDPKLVQQIAAGLGLTFVAEKEHTPNPSQEGNSFTQLGCHAEPVEAQTFAPIDLLDYIYAVLHSPAYREKYKEFLKIDFPRVPYPADAGIFWQLVALGGELRQIHLLESPVVEKRITGYDIDGDNIVVKPFYKDGNVYVNDTQYFSGVPEIAWNFYIGGYQPAQKWLKDRKGRELSYEDIFHYQKIIVALTETARIMQEIDGVLVV